VDTTVPPGKNYAKISKIIVDELKELGPKPSVSNIPPEILKRKVSSEVGLAGPRPNTYTTIKGESTGPRILLNGHVDVVPAQPEGWTSDPFEPVLRNGMIFGRGAADMKGSDASIIFSLKALVESGAKFQGSITATFTTDEEVGGYTGVNHLIERRVITRDIDYCLSTDSGIDALYVASLGDAEFLITVHGKPAHSGRGWTGVNAIEYGAALIEKLKKLADEISNRRSRIDADPGYGIKKMRPGLYITMVNGGLKGNIIPDRCEILVDRRFIPEEKLTQVRAEIGWVVKKFVTENPEVRVEIKPILGYEPMRINPNGPLVRILRGAARKVLGHDVRPVGSQGSTDIAAVSALGVPVAVLGATRKDSNIHGIDEHVRVKDLVSVTKILAHTYLELSRI
jgi:succinyl-diaminopimelate desuccinylase